jgi:drug/metabolite transporter (DMT)-like permease
MRNLWSRNAPQLLLLLMIAIWGASYAAVKATLERGVPPFVLLAARFSIAAACLLPLALASGRAALASERGRGIATGLTLLIGYALQTTGMQQTTASLAGFLSGLITLFVAAGAVLLGERLRAPTVLGLALGTVGLALLCFGGEPPPDSARAPTNTLLGIGLQVGSSCCYAAHILLLSHWSRPGREIPYCWWQLATVAAGVTMLAPLPGVGPLDRYASDPVVAFCILYLGVFALAIGIAVQSRVQPKIPATQVAVLFAAQPGFAAVGGAVFLGDRLQAAEWTGGALIAAGVLTAELLRARRA